MYCKYCGKEVDNDAVICPGCGKLTDKGNQVVKPVSASSASNVQPKAQKKESLSKGTILALTAFFCYAVGMMLNTIVTLIGVIDKLYVPGSTAGQVGVLIVSGIFFFFSIAFGITSFVISCIEKDSLYKRIFPLVMMIVGIWYLIYFICAFSLLFI